MGRWKGWPIFGVLLLIMGCGKGRLDVRFPPKIGDYHLARLISGKEAIEEINRLHGRVINAIAGAIAIYNGEEGSATIWVSLAPSSEKAECQVQEMMREIQGRPGGPFFGVQKEVHREIPVYRFQGLGQMHFVFRRDKQVYWVSTPPEAAKDFLSVFM